MSLYTLGLDFGGGGGRAVLLDLETGDTTVAAKAWSFSIAPDTGGLGVDVDPDLTWKTLGALSREVIARAGARPEQVAGVAATAMRLGNVVLDADGVALLAVPNRDARAAGPGILLAMQHGEAIQRAMGRWPYPIHTAARLQWLQQNRPELLERADCVLSLSDWLGHRLCGERGCEATQAAETLLFELEARAWSTEWTAALGIDAALLPTVVTAGTRLGGLTPQAAAHLGLAPGTCVGVGGADTQCALLGAGAVRAGEVGVVGGTTAPVQHITDRAIVDPDVRVWSSQHLVPGRWVLESNAGPLGETLDWMARVLYPDADAPVAQLLDAAATQPAGARGMLSSLGASVLNDREMGLPSGHLTLSHLVTGRDPRPGSAVARAVVEGMACGLSANLAQVESLAGEAQGPLVLCGGLSRSRFFAELLAGVAGRTVRRTLEPATSGVGAALCAAVAAGHYASLDEAGDERRSRTELHAPRDDESEALAALFDRWTRWRTSAEPLDRVTAELTLPFALAGQQEMTGDDSTGD